MNFSSEHLQVRNILPAQDTVNVNVKNISTELRLFLFENIPFPHCGFL
jgi:hypothetical protein